MDLAYIKSGVRTLLGDDQYDGDVIAMAANWFQYQLFNDHRLRMAESSEEISISAGDTTAPLPGDLMTWITLYVTSGARVYSIKDDYVQYDSFMSAYANFASVSAQEVRAWTDYGNEMRLAAPAKADTTILVDYLREPELMEDDGDDCEIPRRYEEMMLKGTLVRLMDMDEDYDVSDKERERLDAMVTTFVRNEGRGGGKTGPHVMRTRRGRGSWRADRDF